VDITFGALTYTLHSNSQAATNFYIVEIYPLFGTLEVMGRTQMQSILVGNACLEKHHIS
jgi:hypothetical protein